MREPALSALNIMLETMKHILDPAGLKERLWLIVKNKQSNWQTDWQQQCAMDSIVILIILPKLFVLRTSVSARSYRASAFLLDWLCFCGANKFIHTDVCSL